MTRRYDQGAQSLVEFALILPVMLLILLGIFDFGRAIYAYNTLSNAAREAVRLAIVDQNTTAITAEARRSALGLDPSTINVSFSTSCALIGCTGQVTVEHQWRAITPIIGSLVGPINLSSVTEMRIERVYTSP